jgi:hypothetical protein
LLFFTFSFYLYGFSGGFHNTSRKLLMYIYFLFDVSDLLLYSLLSIAFLCTIRTSKSSS